MGLKWNLQRGGGIQTKKPSVGGVWIFSGTTQFLFKMFSFPEGLGNRKIAASVTFTLHFKQVFFHLEVHGKLTSSQKSSVLFHDTCYRST